MYCDALRYLTLSGVRWEINEKPNTPTHDESVAVNAATGQRVATIVPPIAPIQTVSPTTATAMALRPTDIDSLCRMIDEFNHPLRRSATHVVLPHIAPTPNGVLVLTDMPSTDDDASGKILSGTAGEMVDKMLNAIEMSRDSVSIVPILFWRTPGGRTPTHEEIALSRPFVDRLIDMIKPKLILSLGTLPTTEFGNVHLSKNHGVPIDIACGAKMIPIYHPNYLVLKPSAKRDVWSALQNVQNLLKTVQK